MLKFQTQRVLELLELLGALGIQFILIQVKLALELSPYIAVLDMLVDKTVRTQESKP